MLKDKYPRGGSHSKIVKLPAPRTTGSTSIEEALSRRRSVREFTGEALALEDVSQLLWAAQGITDAAGGRTAPSAGACYPLETYLVSGDVKGLDPGFFHYLPLEHSLKLVLEGDVRPALSGAANEQLFIKDAPASVVFSAVYERTKGRYGKRGERYVHMDAAHAAQNIHLQVISLGLGTVVVGAFNDEDVAKLLAFPSGEKPLVIMPVGREKAGRLIG